jgi:hypothetical protein
MSTDVLIWPIFGLTLALSPRPSREAVLVVRLLPRPRLVKDLRGPHIGMASA